MNLKKLVISLITISIFVAFIFSQNMVFATVTENPIYLGITEIMTRNEPNMGYAIGDPNTNQQTGMAAKIWNIVKYSSESSKDLTQANIFCVKAGVGFSDTKRREKYDVFYNMKTERETIKAQNDVLKELVEGTIKDGDKTISRYDALLAAIDMLYLPGKSTEAEKTQLLNDIIEFAKKPDSGYTDFVGLMQQYPLTDDDIMAVQQAALWYFTNYGEENGKYDKTSDKNWLNYTTDGINYKALNNYTPNNLQQQYDAGQARTYQAEVLYNYIIKQAKANANKYTNPTETTGKPAKVNTTELKYKENGNNYIVGPINISETEGNTIPYTIDFVVKNNNEAVNNYKLLDKNEKNVETGTTVKDLVGQDFYISIPKDNIKTLSINININYKNTKMTLWASNTNNQAQPVVIPEKTEESIPVELKLTFENSKTFDLALRKYITKINGIELKGAESRVPSIDESTLETGTTATYKHRKDPVTVQTGDKVIYKLTIYNEGEKAGRATKVIDQLPTGLKFVKVVSGSFELDSYTEETNRLKLKRLENDKTDLSAYEKGKLSSETIEIECEVIAKPDTKNNKILTNVAWISEEYDSEDNKTITNKVGEDRDSEPATEPKVNKDNMSDYKGDSKNKSVTPGDSSYYYKGEQDDDDFEKLILLPKAFDLKLIKRIVAVNGQAVPERIESVNVDKLNTLDENGNMITTADYKLNKNPVGVKKGDIVTYTFRIYNEGDIDGYASEITEDIPEGLEFLWSEKTSEELKADEKYTEEEKEAIEFNQKYLWGKFKYDDKKEKVIQVSSDYLSKENETTVNGNLIKAFDKEKGYIDTENNKNPDYKELSIMLKVVSEDTTGTVIRNEACISEDTDKDGNSVDDRDSDTDKWIKYEDDEDYDNIILKSFDLSLRKFIIAVSKDEKIEDEEYLKNEDGSYKRAPVVDTSKLNTKDENGKLITTAIYNHTKEPILVQKNDIIVYNLRVYNEGDINGYAAEIKDHLPSYLEFVDGEFNKKYGWTVSEDGRTVTTKYLENALIKAATLNEKAKDGDKDRYILTYKEVPIMCRVKSTAKTNENITNIADITKYLDEDKKEVTDRDSEKDNVKIPEDKDLPGYKDDEKGDYIPGQEDDDDFEKIIVREFDLALRKWVTHAIVIDKNGQTVTETGHQPYDDPEQVVKVELNRKKLKELTVKFKYSIRVINEGDIEGYAKEITDYVPEGLKFVAEDNPGWKDEGNNVISTRLLENTLLKPGEYADVEVILTWINNENNMGLKTNVAEISEDHNEYDVPDRDSTPDNQKPGEDDIDDAPVMLSVTTGKVKTYFTLGFIILITMAGGVFLIKKFVL